MNMGKDHHGENTTGNRERKDFPIITREAYFKIELDSIESIEQRGKNLHVMTVDGSEYVFKGRIEDVAEIIAGKCFYRVMKKIVVNFNNVKCMGSNSVRFKSGMVYGIGRNNFIKMRRAYKNYLLGYPPYTFCDNTGIQVAEKELTNDGYVLRNDEYERDEGKSERE